MYYSQQMDIKGFCCPTKYIPFLLTNYMYEFDTVLSNDSFWSHGAVAMSANETHLATLRKDGRVDLWLWPSMEQYKTIGRADTLFIQTFTGRNTLLIQNSRSFLTEYNWEGRKLKHWKVSAESIVTSGTDHVAIMHSSRRFAKVFSYKTNTWTSPIHCMDYLRNLVGLTSDGQHLTFTNDKATDMYTVDACTGDTMNKLQLPPALKTSVTAAPIHGHKALIVAESRFDASKIVCTIIDLHRRQASRIDVPSSTKCFFPLNNRVSACVYNCGYVQLAYLNVAMPIVLFVMADRLDVGPKTKKLILEFLKPSAMECC